MIISEMRIFEIFEKHNKIVSRAKCRYGATEYIFS